ncbi:MAG: hypothetical protein WBW04_00340 [Nitrolancea sp.]
MSHVTLYDVAVFVRRFDALCEVDVVDCDEVADESVALFDDVPVVLDVFADDVVDPLLWTSAVVPL